MLNLFRVGVTVALMDRVSGALGTIGAALDKAHHHTSSYQDGIKKLQSQMDKLGAAKMIGQEAFHASVGALDAMIDPAKEYTSQIVRMNMAGLEHETIANNIGAAWETAGKVMTTTATDNLRTLSELYGVITEKGGSMQEARELLPRFQEMKMVLMASSEHPIEDVKVEGLAYDAVKAAEMVGKTGKEDIIHMADMMEKVMIASGGKITPTDYQNFFKYARAAKMTLSEEELFTVVPELMIEMKSRGGGSGGSGGPGTMYASLFSTLVQGTMSKATSGNLRELGLLSGPELQTTTTGTVTQGTDWRALVGSDPRKWIMEKLIPAILAKKPELENDNAAMALEIARVIKGPRLTTALVGEIWNKDEKGIIEKFRENRNRVPGHDELVEQAKSSPRVLDASFAAQWTNLMTVLGEEVMPAFLPMIAELAGGFSAFGKFLKENKWAAELIVMTTATVAAVSGLVALGAMIGLALIPLAALGIGFGGFALIAATAGAAVFGLITLFKFVPPLLRDIQRGWNLFVTGLQSGLIALIDWGSEFIGDLVSRFDKTEGEKIKNAGHMVAYNQALKAPLPLFDVKPFRAPGSEAPKYDWMQDGEIREPVNLHQANIGEIHVHQQPGESSDALVEKIMQKLNNAAEIGLLTSAKGYGTSSAASLAASIAGGGY